MELIINALDFRGSVVDGPGVRSVIYVQGCYKHCPGCHNFQTWDPSKGTAYPVEELADIIRQNSPIKKLTISGGEPLLQLDALIQLVKELKDFNSTVYTGFEFDQVPKKLLPHIDYLKVGPFIEKLKSTIIPFAGSTNQQFLVINREAKEYDEYEKLIS